MRQVEDALAHQVIYGGDLITNLLEVAAVDEVALTTLLAQSMNLAAAPAGALPAPTDAVQALLPGEMAIEWSVVPLEVVDGRLVLAVAGPLSRQQEAQLALVLGMGIDQRAALTVRVRQAVAGAYGAPLDRRLDKLLARLSDAFSPATVRGTGTPAFGTVAQQVPRKAMPAAPPQHRVTSGGFPGVAPPSQREPGPAPVTVPPPGGEGRVGLLQRKVSTSLRAAHRRRGPVTAEAAKQAAEEATDRDTLLEDVYKRQQQPAAQGKTDH